MYGVFTYICLKFMVNVGEYTVPGAFGHGENKFFTFFFHACAVPAPRVVLEHPSAASDGSFAGLLPIESMYLGNLL